MLHKNKRRNFDDYKTLNNIESVFMLDAICRYQRKKQAAKELNVSVDTMNKYIDVLEQSLGVKLVSAVSIGCTLTQNEPKTTRDIPKIRVVIDYYKELFKNL